MQQFDEAMARRVWNRVQGKSDHGYPKTEVTAKPPEPPALQPMIRLTEQTARRLFVLSQRAKGKDRPYLQQMAGRYQKQTKVLRGLCKLQQGQLYPTPPADYRKETTEQLCRNCIGDLQRLQQDCRRWETEEFSSVFAQQVSQTQKDLEVLLRFLAGL